MNVTNFDTKIYQWQPRAAGTWLYQNHVATPHDFEMGLFGLLVVDPHDDARGQRLAYKNGPAYDVEKFWVLDDVDPAWHQPGETFDAAHDGAQSGSREPAFDPKYFLLNGTVNTAALNHRDCAVEAKVGDKLLLRLMNASYSLLKITFENLHGDIVSVDGTAIDTVSCPWSSWIPVHPGKPVVMATGSRHDLLIDLDPARNAVAAGQSYKVVFEFVDLTQRRVRNENSANPLHVGRITTTISVA